MQGRGCRFESDTLHFVTGLKQALRHQHFVLLFVALLAFILVQPFFEGVGRQGVLALFTSFVLIAAMVAVSSSVALFAIGMALGLPLFVALWAVALSSFGANLPDRLMHKADVLQAASGAAFHGYIALLMFRQVAQARHVNLNTLSGAACIYLLAGVSWAFAYALVHLGDDAAFQIAEPLAEAESMSVQLFVYFSFTTLTTLGYGDMSPVNPVARALANLEAVFGVLFTTIVIARFVGVYLTEARFERRRRDEAGEPTEP